MSGQSTEPTSDARRKVPLHGPLAFMAQHSVAANLAMFIVIVAGLLAAFGSKQEVFPEFDLDMVTVTVPYPGASPEEVEQGIVLATEEAVRGLDGVKRVTSTAAEGAGAITIELELGSDANAVLADVKNAIDRITTYPEDAEEPTVSVATRKRAVISLIVSGDQSLRSLHGLAERARADLLQSPEITQVEISGVPPLEISVEVGRDDLEAYGLTLDQVAQAIRAASVELPGGGIDTRGGEILLRVADRRVSVDEFANIVLRGTAAGHEIRLGDIATIKDGYEDTDEAYYFNGKRAVSVTAYRVGDETPTRVADAVKAYAEKLQAELEGTVEVTPWKDDSILLRERIDLLGRNAFFGFFLVLMVLALFLQRRLAGWVALGVPVSFLGALLVMGPLGASINMVTLFALIVTLGIVVDDAIVVSENIHARRKQGMGALEAAVVGTREMAMPVTFSVLTTIAAFAPLLFVPGVLGKIFRLIPLVVIAVLLFSLLESFFVLPAHLAHSEEGKKSKGLGSMLTLPFRFLFGPLFLLVDWMQVHVSAWLERFTMRRYRPFLGLVLRWRGVTLAFSVASLVVVGAMVAAGLVPFSFFPKLEGNDVSAGARLPYGTPIERTMEVRAALEAAARKAIAESGGDGVVRGMFTKVGEGRASGHGAAPSGSHLVSVEVNLVPGAERDFTSIDFEQRWRAALPDIPGVETLTIGGGSGPSAGKAVDVQLSHTDTEVLAKASAELAEELTRYSTTANIENGYAAGKTRFDFSLLPEGYSLGLTSNHVARALRASFYGEQALREQRGRNEVRVMVRLPEEERSSEFDIDELIIGTPSGGFVPLSSVATFKRSRAPTEIRRESGRRIVNVSAELGAGAESSRSVLESLTNDVFPRLKERYPELGLDLVGQQRERDESLSSLGPMYLLAMFGIFALLAIPFRSYLQPMIVMSAIPFGVLGAVLGHMIMGYGLSFISILGIVALSGVVVNDSLVLVDAVNRNRRAGMSVYDALIAGATVRLRPILLTSLTTFFGLIPMIFETSRQAQFLIPMAISLGFGVLFATLVVLVVVPCLYFVVEGVRNPAPESERLASAGVPDDRVPAE